VISRHQRTHGLPHEQPLQRWNPVHRGNADTTRQPQREKSLLNGRSNASVAASIITLCGRSTCSAAGCLSGDRDRRRDPSQPNPEERRISGANRSAGSPRPWPESLYQDTGRGLPTVANKKPPFVSSLSRHCWDN